MLVCAMTSIKQQYIQAAINPPNEAIGFEQQNNINAICAE